MEDNSSSLLISLFAPVLIEYEDDELRDPDATLPSAEWLEIMEARLAPSIDDLEDSKPGL
jgi:hypothetical protein